MNPHRHAYAIALLLVLAGALLVFLVSAGGGQDGQPPAPPANLFVAVDTTDWVDPVETANPALIRSRPVVVAFDVLAALDPQALDAQPGAAVAFNLFDDFSLTVIFDHAEPRWAADFLAGPMEPVGYSWRGSLAGNEQGDVVMITEPGVCDANIHVAGAGWFEVRPLGEGVHVVRQFFTSDTWVCGVGADQAAPAEAGAPQGINDGIPQNATGCDDGTTIDAIVLYTPAAKADGWLWAKT